MTPRLSIALLTHSTNPRGGVVHALELGDALTRLGHRVTVHAPGEPGASFFRTTSCRTVVVPASRAGGDLADRVEARIGDFVRYFSEPTRRVFDVWHCGDGIGGNALAALAEAGRIGGFARTVHHLDAFADPQVAALERRSIEAAAALFVVSRHGLTQVAESFGREAVLVGNGVDRGRFSPLADRHDAAITARIGGHGAGPLFLSIGGIEARKNTLQALAAFIRFQRQRPDARWVIAGGASVLDHGAYRAAFDRALADSGLPEGAVTVLGPVADEQVPALYRAADALLFPSLNEGFGLAVIEAMACGTPAIVPAIAPFTEYLDAAEAVWCDPSDVASIAAAMAAAVDAPARRRLIAGGFDVADRHAWATVARAHLATYARLAADVRPTEFAHA